MTIFKKALYYCHECKKILPGTDSLLFIDDQASVGFCSEECIEDFHLPIVKNFEEEFVFLRAQHHIGEENLGIKLDQQLVDAVLMSPDEIYRFSNEIGEAFHHFIKKHNDVFIIVIASLFKSEPAFIFGATTTKVTSLVNEFRQGQLISVSEWIGRKRAKKANLQKENVDGVNEDLSEEDMVFLQLLESKKSKILATLLIKRQDSDIGIESFSDYDFCFQETLDHPDEVFEHKDNEGDIFFNYIKNYNLGKRKEDNFFYIVSCLKRKGQSADETMVYPILGMPTNDMAMVQEFCLGKQISGPLKN